MAASSFRKSEATARRGSWHRVLVPLAALMLASCTMSEQSAPASARNTQSVQAAGGAYVSPEAAALDRLSPAAGPQQQYVQANAPRSLTPAEEVAAAAQESDTNVVESTPLPAGPVSGAPAYPQAASPQAARSQAPAEAAGPGPTPQPAVEDPNTYDEKTVLGAATGLFGEGAEGLGRVIERIFADLGRPNAYIVGKEGGGAIIVGLRYGDGTLYHKVEGEQKVHWTGPSVGFDIGGDASKAFVLVYNLYDSQEIFKRYPAMEGKLYLIGGFSVSYHQRDDVIVVPVRLGAGWRLGANIGYYHFTKDRKYVPF